jgi:hypothetical protein
MLIYSRFNYKFSLIRIFFSSATSFVNPLEVEQIAKFEIGVMRIAEAENIFLIFLFIMFRKKQNKYISKRVCEYSMGKNVHISQFLLISHNSQHERRKENI